MSFKILLSSLRQNLIIKRNFRCSQLRMKDIKAELTDPTEITDKPIKFTTSDAAKWKAIYSDAGEDYYNTPRIQPFVVMMSLTAFMVYFCILREENDLDDMLRDLERNVPLQVEEAQLRVDIQYGRQHGQDVSYLEARFKEIQENKKSH